MKRLLSLLLLTSGLLAAQPAQMTYGPCAMDGKGCGPWRSDAQTGLGFSYTTTPVLSGSHLRAIPNVGTPTVTPTGGTATTWAYKVVARLQDGTTTAASSAGSTAAGAATLTSSAYNTISWTAVAGTYVYDVYRTTAGTSPSTTGLIGSTASTSLVDTGLAGDSSTAPAVNTTGTLRLYEPASSSVNYVGLKAGTLSADTVWTLPTADGTSGQALTTNASGVLSWATPPGVPGGSDTQIQFNNAGAFAGVSGSAVTAATGAIALTSQNAASTPFTVAGAAAQSEPHVRIEPKDAAVNAGVIRQSAQAAGASSKAGLGLTVRGDDAVAGTSVAGAAAGGSITLTAGAAARYSSGNANGGDINLVTGAGIGTGVAGLVKIPDTRTNIATLQFAGNDTGLASQGSYLYFRTGGSQVGYWGNSTSGLMSSYGFSWSYPGSGEDTWLKRRAARHLEFGIPSASPAAYTLTGHSSRGGTDTDVAGGAVTYSGGLGTGTGGGGDLKLGTAPKGSTGTTQNVYSDRVVLAAKQVTLAESSATAVLDVAVASGTVAGGEVQYTIRADDGTDFQALSGRVRYAVVNKAGTLTCSIALVGSEVVATSSGTLTNTVTCTTGTDSISINLNAVSSLTQTTLHAFVRAEHDGTGVLTTK